MILAALNAAHREAILAALTLLTLTAAVLGAVSSLRDRRRTYR